ncbi:MAG TPA: hypothetical protein VGU25_17305 [Acidobacteriaceae bacterium]|nr:hypothetical protein [Acidobacteriaceae bacterium]
MSRKQIALLSGIVLLCLAKTGNAQVPKADRNHEADIRSDMVKFNPHYREFVVPRRNELNALTAQIESREAAGEKVTCSHQIAIETRWLLGYTADFPRIDQRLSDLKESLAHPERESRAEQEDPHDGSWGGCYTEWFERLDASYDVLQMEKARGIAPKYRFSLLDRVNSPEKLRAYFASITTSDVARTGVDHRKELNAAFVDLIRLIVAGDPAEYPWDPRLKQELLNLTFNQYRNQQTGWWGESYIHDSRREYVDDLSITFHIVVALDDDVPLKRKVARTLFALQDMKYPAGWSENQSNHDNMDVIVLMRATWNEMTPEQRERGAEIINRMLHWCLTESLQPDGSFRPGPGGDDSIEEGEHFGVAFLSRIGYFDKSKRFWTSQDFPEAETNRQHIIQFIKAHQNTGAAGGAYYSSALHEITQ